jgi:hypothetical protein
MFLVTMSHGIVENQIEKLKISTKNKQEALILSDKMLKRDHEDFNK